MQSMQSYTGKKIVKVIFALAVLIIFAVYIFSINRTQRETIPTQKQAVIERLQDADTKPLSSEEKSQIINFVSRGGATYTDAEKEEIARILRAQ